MKTLITILLLISPLSVMAQEKLESTNNHGFFLTLGYAPYKSYTYRAPGPDMFFPNSCYMGIESRLRKKISVALGIGYMTKEIYISRDLFDTPIIIWERTLNNYRYFNIPIDFKYTFFSHSSALSVSGLFGFTNSFYNYKAVGSSSFNENINIDQSYYELYLNLGFCLDVKLYNRFSFIFQPTLGYGLVSEWERIRSGEVLAGIKYKLK